MFVKFENILIFATDKLTANLLASKSGLFKHRK